MDKKYIQVLHFACKNFDLFIFFFFFSLRLIFFFCVYHFQKLQLLPTEKLFLVQESFLLHISFPAHKLRATRIMQLSSRNNGHFQQCRFGFRLKGEATFV